MTQSASSILSAARRVFPVVHFLNRELALEQCHLALESGADGVFLIDHHGNDHLLLEVACAAKAVALSTPAFANRLIGVNLLSTRALDALQQVRKTLESATPIDMIWSDSPGVHSQHRTQEALQIAETLTGSQNPIFFGSVAFKHQAEEPDPPQAAALARSLGMLPTTSGPRTGSPPSVDKIATMAQTLAQLGGITGTRIRLAIASGMDNTNVGAFLPFLTDILVATGVSHDAHRFNPMELRRFVRQVHGFNGTASARLGNDVA